MGKVEHFFQLLVEIRREEKEVNRASRWVWESLRSKVELTELWVWEIKVIISL